MDSNDLGAERMEARAIDSEKSRAWWVDGSVSAHCCFVASLVAFDRPVTLDEAKAHLEYKVDGDERMEGRNLLEVLDATDLEMRVIRAAVSAALSDMTMSKITRTQAEALIREQFASYGEHKERFTADKKWPPQEFHYGKCELVLLLDAIYGEREDRNGIQALRPEPK